MTNQIAILTEINENIEEEVTVRIGNIEFTGFANIIPYQLVLGNKYDVLIGVTVLDEFQITETTLKVKELKPLNYPFKYLIRGILKKDGIIDAGIIIQDEILEEYEYLLDKYVEIEVDRISIEFM